MPGSKKRDGIASEQKNRIRQRADKFKESDIYPDVYQQICKGYKLADIAKMVQEKSEPYKKYHINKIIGILTVIKRDLPAAAFLEKQSPDRLLEIQQHAKNQVDVLEELNKLYQNQLKRVIRATEQENILNMNMANLDITIKTAKDIVKDIHIVKTDLGLSPKHLGTLDVNAQVLQGVIHKFSQEPATKTLENPVSRHKVLTVAERILAIAAQPKALENKETTNLIADLLNGKSAAKLAVELKEKEEKPVILEDQGDFIDQEEVIVSGNSQSWKENITSFASETSKGSIR